MTLSLIKKILASHANHLRYKHFYLALISPGVYDVITSFFCKHRLSWSKWSMSEWVIVMSDQKRWWRHQEVCHNYSRIILLLARNYDLIILIEATNLVSIPITKIVDTFVTLRHNTYWATKTKIQIKESINNLPSREIVTLHFSCSFTTLTFSFFVSEVFCFF